MNTVGIRDEPFRGNDLQRDRRADRRIPKNNRIPHLSSAQDITDEIKGLYPFIGMAALRTNTLITEEASYRHERFFNESKDLFHERCFQ